MASLFGKSHFACILSIEAHCSNEIARFLWNAGSSGPTMTSPASTVKRSGSTTNGRLLKASLGQHEIGGSKKAELSKFGLF